MSVLSNDQLMMTDDGYNIQRSLRFRSSASAYLNRTYAATGNTTTYTFSTWLKRGQLSTDQLFFHGSGAYYAFDTTRPDALTGNLRGAGATNYFWTTNAVFRDPSAWYHIVFKVDTTQATAADRFRLYVNGVEQSFSSISYPPQNNVMWSTGERRIGYATSNLYPFDGYLAEVNFIDGQALTPSSFGQTDAVTGVWVPKKYTGTYGTNGFYLPFSDNTSATTLAYDKSGNSNNWTPNNISTTAGATYDSMTDVPTLTSTTVANYAVLNPLRYNATYATITDTNLKFSSTTPTYDLFGISTIGVSSGKWYFEASSADATVVFSAGMVNGTDPVDSSQTMFNSASTYLYMFNGNKRNNNSSVAYGATFTTNDVIGVAIDLDGGTIAFYKNGVSQGTAYSGISGTFFPSVTTYGTGGTKTVVANFGQRPFSYTPPTGFKALNTFNLPDPTIKKPNQYMDATTYTGTGSALSVTNAAGFQPDFVWVKGRSGATDHALYDAVRGVQKQLESNTTTAETTETTGLTAFNSNGFSVGALAQMNTNTATYVGWQWKAGGASVTNTSGSITSTVSVNTTAGFSVVTYTGTGANATVGHGLGVAPKMVIVKNRNAAGYNWVVWHTSLTSGAYYLLLNGTAAQASDATVWNSTIPTSTVFSIGTSPPMNTNNNTQVAYLFAEIAGFSKFGSYTGNGSADGPFVYCGFRPKYVMVKSSSAVTSWYVLDSVRDTYNIMGNELVPNTSNSEAANQNDLDFTSNGFKWRVTAAAFNGNGSTYIYAAFAENPFKYSLAR